VGIGTRIVTTTAIAYVGGWNSNSRHPGEPGTIAGYATPELQQRQVRPWESYYVTLDGETGQRVLNRDAFTVVPDAP
jgi:hypothetical protein